MVLPVAVPIAVAGASALLNAFGASAAKKANAYAQNQQTQTSNEEFAKRTQLANEIFAENTGISRQTYDDLARLSDEEFAQRTGVSKDTFDKLSEIDRQQVIRDAAAADANIATGRDIRTQRDTSRDAVKAQYEADLAAANAKQDTFRGQGDAEAQNLVAAFTPAAMQGRQTAATAGRDALAAQSVTQPTTGVRVDPALQAMFAARSKEGVGRALAQSGAISKVAGYGDALAGGDQAINRSGENVGFIKDAATRALAPLGAQLGVSSAKFNNAAVGARDRSAVADADLEAALSISKQRAAGEARPVNQYGADMDAALAAFFGGRTNSTAGRGDALIGANTTRLAGTNSVSSNFENNMNDITRFRAANTVPTIYNTLGQFAGAVTPSLFSKAAAQKGTQPPATVP